MAYFRQLRTKAARGPTRLHEVAGLRGLFSEDENQQGESDLAYDATCHRLQTVRRPTVSRRSARGGRTVGIDGGVARFPGGNPHAPPRRKYGWERLEEQLRTVTLPFSVRHALARR